MGEGAIHRTTLVRKSVSYAQRSSQACHEELEKKIEANMVFSMWAVGTPWHSLSLDMPIFPSVGTFGKLLSRRSSVGRASIPNGSVLLSFQALPSIIENDAVPLNQ